jgi:hypothetical protein
VESICLWGKRAGWAGKHPKKAKWVVGQIRETVLVLRHLFFYPVPICLQSVLVFFENIPIFNEF